MSRWLPLAVLSLLVVLFMSSCGGGSGGGGIDFEPILHIRIVPTIGAERISDTGNELNVVRAENSTNFIGFLGVPHGVIPTWEITDPKGEVIVLGPGVYKFKTVGPVGKAYLGPKIVAIFQVEKGDFKRVAVYVVFR